MTKVNPCLDQITDAYLGQNYPPLTLTNRLWTGKKPANAAWNTTLTHGIPADRHGIS